MRYTKFKLSFSAGTLTVTGDDNNNILHRPSGFQAADTVKVIAGAGDDIVNLQYLVDYTGADTVFVTCDDTEDRDYDDTIHASKAADIIDGGLGSDMVNYSFSNEGIMLFLGWGGHGYGGSAQGDILTNIEKITGSRFDDMIIGGAEDNTFIGGLGSDTLYGDDGGDLLNGGYGADILDGGDGIDTIAVGGEFDSVSVNLETGVGKSGQAEGDRYRNIENVRTGQGDDTVIGNDEDNVIFAGEGNDRIDGRGGDDTLQGGRGRDTMEGGAGADTFIVGNDLIVDFENNIDKIAFEDYSGGPASFDDLTITDVAGHAVVTYEIHSGIEMSLTVLNSAGTLDAGDFIF